MKTNILYVITKLELGGAQKQLLSLLSGINKERYKVFLFSARRGMLVKDVISLKGVVFNGSDFLERPVHPFKDLLALIELTFFIRKNQIAIVHTHSSKAGIIGRLAAGLAGVKTVLHTVHGWPFHKYQHPLQRLIFIWLERFAARFCQKIITVSAFDRDTGSRHRIGSVAQYTLIRYGIDYAEFEAASADGAKEEFDVESGGMLVTNISCFKPQKAPLDYIRLAAIVSQRLPKVKFLLVGDGYLRPKLLRLVERLRLKDKVVLPGWRRDISRILSASEVFVLTSLWEGLPVTVMEAMASSRPVVVTDTGSVREAVSAGRCGFLVQPGNIRDMAEAVCNLLENEKLRLSMGNAAHAALRWRRDEMIDKTERLYESCRQ